MEPRKDKIKFGSDYEITASSDSLTIWVRHLSTGKVYSLEVDAKIVKMLRRPSPQDARDTLVECFNRPEGIELLVNGDRIKISISDELVEEDPRGMFFQFTALFHHQEESIGAQTQNRLNKENHQLPEYLQDYIINLQDRVGDKRLIFPENGVSNLSFSPNAQLSFEETKNQDQVRIYEERQENSISGLNTFTGDGNSSEFKRHIIGFDSRNLPSNSNPTNFGIQNIVSLLRSTEGISFIAAVTSTGSGSGSGSGSQGDSNILHSLFTSSSGS